MPRTVRNLRVMTSRAQEIQEAEYAFPYHHVPQFTPRFSHLHVDAWAINYVSTIEYLLDLVRTSSAQSILDLGCGDGRLTLEIHRRFPDRSVVGVDYSERAIQLARALNPQVNYQHVDIVHEPVLGAPFDMVLLIEVIEHIPVSQLPAFLTAACSLVRPGGTVHVTVPHANAPLEPKHEQHFTVDSLCEVLARHGELVTVRPFEKRGFGRRLLNRALANRLFALRNPALLDLAYRVYKSHLFEARDERECLRIYAELRRPLSM